MSETSSDFQAICLKCGAVYDIHASKCPQCGHINVEVPPIYHPSRKKKLPRGPLLPDLSILIKPVIFIVIIAAGSWLIYQACDHLFRSVEQANPYPTDPVVTTTQFFEALQNEDYQSCYGLMNKERKISTVIDKNSRENYFNHFARIREYLRQRVEPDFTWNMQVSPDGKHVQFGVNTSLHLTLVPTRGLDKLSHYAIKQINEFPIDIAPGIGMEKYQRQLNRIVESTQALSQEDDDMDIADILETRSYETKTQRRNRMIEAFKFQRQLDTRHTLLEWIIDEYPNDSTVQSFLAKIARDDAEVIQLRNLARNHTGTDASYR